MLRRQVSFHCRSCLLSQNCSRLALGSSGYLIVNYASRSTTFLNLIAISSTSQRLLLVSSAHG